MRSSDVTKLIRKLLLICVPLALLLGRLELRVRCMPNSFNRKMQVLSVAEAQCQTLILGASEAYQGIDPQSLGPGALNLANNSQDLYYDLKFLEREISRMPGLRQVLVPITYASFQYTLIGAPEDWRMFAYHVYCGLKNEDPRAWKDVRNWSSVALVGPTESMLELWQGFKGETQIMDENGFCPVEPLAETADNSIINPVTAAKRVAWHHSIMHATNILLNRRYLSQLISLAQGRGLQVLLLTTPVSAAYAEAVAPEQRALMLQEVAAQCHAFKVPYFDLFRDARFTRGDFADCNHLNRNGARKFTKLLAGELAALKDQGY